LHGNTVKTGHKKRVINGISGVLVPGENCGKPWKVQRVHGAKTAKSETVHQPDAEDPGADSDEAETKYQEMVDDQEVAYERAAVGVTMARLFQMSEEQGHGQSHRAGDAAAVPAATATSAKKDKKKHRGGIGSSDEEAPKRTAGKAKKLVGPGNSKPVRSSSGATAAGNGSGRAVPPTAGTAQGAICDILIKIKI
jgi:hypothetical protein